MSVDLIARAKALLQRLIAFNTISDRSNLPLIEFVEDYLHGLGVSTKRAPNAVGDKAALLATIGPESDGGIVLSGHTDVVPVEGQAWSGDPFTLREIDGKLIGRGACDMKGFDAAVLAMVPEFLAARLERPIHILLSYDEETTCLGSLDVIKRFGADLPRPSAVIVGEPTLIAVADAHKSIATLQTIVTGVEGHSANPRLGANAIAAAGDIVADLGRLGREYEAAEYLDPRFEPPYSTFHVGVIHGGTARNILARECAFHWEYRGLPKMPSGAALARVQKYVDEVALPRLRRFVARPTIETRLEVDVPGLAAEQDSPAATLALALSESNRTIAVSYATEAGHFQQAGLSTIVCGPGSIEQAHVADEFLSVAQLEAYLEFLRRLARRESGG
jgi:acetylornithine deacetylase